MRLLLLYTLHYLEVVKHTNRILINAQAYIGYPIHKLEELWVIHYGACQMAIFLCNIWGKVAEMLLYYHDNNNLNNDNDNDTEYNVTPVNKSSQWLNTFTIVFYHYPNEMWSEQMKEHLKEPTLWINPLDMSEFIIYSQLMI